VQESWENALSFSYPKRLRFQCTRCALCCGDTKTKGRRILLLRSEAEQIVQATSKPIREFADETEGREPYVYEMKKTAKERKCLFLSNNTCAIYETRPLICRFYPFQLTASGDQEYAFLYTKECPGIGGGKVLGKEYFESLFRQACDKLLRDAANPAHS
jgi:Fe-S-cluster containining protein